MSPLFLADMGTNSANGWRSCMLLSHGAISARRWMLSSLLAISSVGIPGLNRLNTLASASVKLPASTTNRIRSTSPMTPITVLLSDLLSAVAWRVWKPGVSTNTNCVCPVVRIPVMRWRVVCALREVMLIFCPTSALSSVDLPTLGLPTMAITPQRWPATSAAAPAGRAAASIASRSFWPSAPDSSAPSATFFVASSFMGVLLSVWPAWPSRRTVRLHGVNRQCPAR